MFAVDLQAQAGRAATRPLTDGAARARRAELVDGEDQIVVRTQAVGRRLGVRELEGPPDARVVPAGDHVPASRRERRERALDLVAAAGIEVDVVDVDVRDDPDRGTRQQERPVALVGLEHEQVPVARPRAAAAFVEVAAHEIAGVQPGALQHDGHHRGGGGLAVGAGDRDRRRRGRQRRQRLLPRPHLDPRARGRPPARRCPLRSRWRRSPRPARRAARGVVSDPDVGAERTEFPQALASPSCPNP